MYKLTNRFLYKKETLGAVESFISNFLNTFNWLILNQKFSLLKLLALVQSCKVLARLQMFKISSLSYVNKDPRKQSSLEYI